MCVITFISVNSIRSTFLIYPGSSSVLTLMIWVKLFGPKIACSCSPAEFTFNLFYCVWHFLNYWMTQQTQEWLLSFLMQPSGQGSCSGPAVNATWVHCKILFISVCSVPSSFLVAIAHLHIDWCKHKCRYQICVIFLSRYQQTVTKTWTLTNQK